MVHDSYHCTNINVTRGTPLKPFAFPTQRENFRFVGEVVKTDIIVPPQKCPMECRPFIHKDWEYC